MNNASQRFELAMRNQGIEPTTMVVADGRLHRFHVRGDKAGTKNGWYELQGDLEAGVFGCWKRGIMERWSRKSPQAMTTGEKSAFDVKMKEITQQHDKELERDHAECRKKAEVIWESITNEGRRKHAYPLRKGIWPYTAKLDEHDNLVIPVRNINRKLQGLQYIKPDGSKKFLSGTAKKGNCSYLGKNPGVAETIIICEGWATGCSLHEATGLPVVIAFDAGNLKPVAEAWRRKLPEHKIIIAGDDDHGTKGNPGRTKATEAAQAVNGVMVFPSFENVTGYSDFNDMHQLKGIDAVNAIIIEASSMAPEDNVVEDDGVTWSEPLLFGDIEAPEIPASLLPKSLGGYCQAVANHTQTPTGLAVMMGLATVATCLQKCFEVSPYGDDYKEPLNIMTVVGLESGSRKTAVISAMTEPLIAWESEQAEVLKETAAKVSHEREMVKKTIDSIKSKGSKPDSTEEDRRNAIAEIEKLEASMSVEIVKPRLFVDDVTPERLQSLMVEQGERMAIFSDEGGLFEVISGLYTGGSSNINVFLQSHAGSAVRVERQGRSVTLNKPALTFGLSVQPEVISSLASGNKARFRGIGMLARLLYCIPKSTVGHRDIQKRRPIPESAKHNYHLLISRVLSIRSKTDVSGRKVPRILTLTPEALEKWVQFSQDVESKQGLYGEFNSIKDWTGKLPGAVLRIAGLCHVVEHGSKITVINKDTIERTIKLAKLLIIHAKTAFGMMGSDPAIADAKAVFQWICSNGSEDFRRGDVHKALHGRFQRVDRLKSALKVLSERHIISDPQEYHTGRRPAIIYRVNPMVLKSINK